MTNQKITMPTATKKKTPTNDAILYRSATFERDVDEDKRTVTLSFSSEEPYERYFGVEILGHKKSEVRLDRIKNAGPLLFNHNRDDHLGRILSAKITGGRGEATVQFSKSAYADEKFNDVKDGILQEVSVGYRVHKVQLIESDDDKDTYRVTDWEPMEISLVTVPADTTVGVSRTVDLINNQKRELEMPETIEEKPEATPTPTPKVEVRHEPDPKAESKGVDNERKRTKEIIAIADGVKERYKKDVSQEANEWISEGKPAEEFGRHLLENVLNAEPAAINPTVGMNDKEKKRYSLVKAIREMSDESQRGLSGLELEAHQEMTKQTKREAKGFFIPSDIEQYNDEDINRALSRMSPHFRALNAETATAGGYTVGTDVGSMIDLLRNATLMNTLGVTMLDGLTGNIAFPRQTGGATAYWLSETGDVTDSEQTFSQIQLTPKRLQASTPYTKQLVAQSSIDIEAFVRADIMAQLAIAEDLAAFHGSGVAGEPKGLFSLDTDNSGINTVTFGAAATRSKMIEFQRKVFTANALNGTQAYVTSAATSEKLMNKDISTDTGRFVWEGSIDQGTVVGKRAYASNQISGNKVAFGNWSHVMVGHWAGTDVVVDPYALKKSGQIELTVTILVDLAYRYPEAFAVSTDSGAQ